MHQNRHIPIPGRPSFLESRKGRILVILAFWTAIAIITATLSHLRMVSLEQPSTFYKWLADSLCAWYGWAALTPLIFWLGRRFLPVGSHWPGRLLVLIMAGAVLCAVQIMYQCFMSMVVMGDPMEKYRSVVIAQIAWLGPWDLLVYAGVVGAGYAREFQLRWRERQLAASKLEVELARAQVAALHAQIHPHFFFNTLNSISVLIRKGESQAAQETLGMLGDLLRFSFSIGNRQLIPLREEITFVTRYLELEQLRFGDRLRVQISVEPSCSESSVPPFLIQPLAENAVRHGLAEKGEPGTVEIRCRKEGNLLVVEVLDDGIGYPAPNRKPGSGVGIANIRSRLERLYSKSSSFEIGARPGGGTAAVVRLPDEWAEGER